MNKMQTTNKYIPDYLVAPGEVLEEYLECAGLTQTALAERTGLSKKTINEIIKAKSAITAETALKFERALGQSAHFWSNLERQYQEDKIRLADKEAIETSLDWLGNFPVNAMAKLGWIEKCRDKVKQLEAVLRFFAVASPTQWETIWDRKLQILFRKTKNAGNNSGVISAWLRQGEIIAQSQVCQQFETQKFQNSLEKIRKLTFEEPAVFVPKLRNICSDAGVAVVFVPAIPGLGIYGATYYLNGKPVMQLSLYFKANDHFWFTFFHEACHIVKHGRRDIFMEKNGLDNPIENEANVFAQDNLIPPAAMRRFLAANCPPSLVQIERFAESVGIAPGIVVGRLQHDKVIPWRTGNHLKVTYTWSKKPDGN